MADQQQESKTISEFQVHIKPPERLLRGMDNLGALVKSVRSLGEQMSNVEETLLRIEMEPILHDLILLGDNIKRAIPHFKQEPCDPVTQRFVSFLELTRQEIEMILRRYGVETLDSVGGTFNPDFHKIVHIENCDSEKDHNLIIEVFSAGYRFEGRILRPAEVVVTRYQNPIVKEK